ncbi:DUF2927 domain-containing protein [Meridianimarinicoccus aquatilis]|uniref:DUF2927 domain-containing protein n=1 Tax=Meridianimarinicoccus aquatilis TaxID=2552766 RepID=A0A4R6AXY8_9RHOB|nr:DUF2927 domain-containing protein [Fluviibacterium aquatile]
MPLFTPIRTLSCAALALAGCASVAPTPDVVDPAVRTPVPEQRADYVPSADSAALALRYSRVERDLINRGLLRTDGGGPDAPFDSRVLTENFLRIALFDEFVPISNRIVARETASPLRRWNDGMEIGLHFGASVNDEKRRRDRASVEALAKRLADASGHPVTTVEGKGNMTVFVVDEDERRALGPALRELVPGLSDSVVNAVTEMPPTTFCMMIAFSTDDQPYVYRRAIGVIRAEHPPLLRRSCFHEEIAQGMGLANDSPEARPSIFNDDEEFALLTRQDELMLTILYDSRLQPGMTATQAQPLIRMIAEELLPPATVLDASNTLGSDDTPPTTEGL